MKKIHLIGWALVDKKTGNIVSDEFMGTCAGSYAIITNRKDARAIRIKREEKIKKVLITVLD
jgi:hypothetical protein